MKIFISADMEGVSGITHPANAVRATLTTSVFGG